MARRVHVGIVILAMLMAPVYMQCTNVPADGSNKQPGQNASPSAVRTATQAASQAPGKTGSPAVAKAATPTITATALPASTATDGLKSEDIQGGTGKEVKSGDTIKIHYSGTLMNGQKFDSSYDRKQPFETKIGVGQVIKGWDVGVIGMKVGGKRRLTIPPDMAYGSRGAGSLIPPNATLIFDLELLEIK